MSAVATKKYAGQSGSRSSGDDRQEEPYIVVGATDLSEAITSTLAAATAASEDTITSGGATLYQNGVDFTFISRSADGTYNYETSIKYGPLRQQLSPINTVKVSYDTTGGTVHTSLAQSETVYTASGGTAPSYDKIIGVQEDSVDGTDVTAPVFNFVVTVVLDRSDVPDPGDVFALTGKYNAATFTVTDTATSEVYSFLAGEVTFLGGRHPDPRSDGLIEMTYVFTASPNIINKTIGDITGIDKLGAQYIWVRFKDDRRGTGVDRVTARKPVHVVVNDVTANGDDPSGDFSVLNIP